MHELSVAQNIIEIVVDHAVKNNADRVTEVVLDIGGVSGVIPETLEFAWEIVAKGSPAENAVLKINFIEAVAFCQECKKEFKMNDIFTICEFCGSAYYEIIRGKELKVKSIVVE
jgi:hydrogenase nickel incorporation protein HypA/HybF